MAGTTKSGGINKKASFLIEFFRQEHASWQGSVVWLDENKRQYFRSALELVRLMDSALEPGNARGFGGDGGVLEASSQGV